VVSTSDGGNTWKEQTFANNYFGIIRFVDASTGYVSGGDAVKNSKGKGRTSATQMEG
ncbi:unnamed protein product, partial [marine sediment metagenome]